MSKNFDVIISGAGIVGAVLALQLAEKGMRVCLIDKADSFLHDNQSQSRYFAISLVMQKVLDKIGVWNFPEGLAEKISNIQVTCSGGAKGNISFNPQDMGEDALGFMVPEGILRRAIGQKIKENKLKHLAYMTASEIVRENVGPNFLAATVRQKNKEMNIRAQILICAEGRSAFSKQSEESSIAWPYQQKALFFLLAHTLPHNGVAFEHFTPYGPLAFLPLPGQKSAVVWSLNQDVAQSLEKNNTCLLHSLIHHFGWGLGDISLASQVRSCELSLLLRPKISRKRKVWIGDAAQSIHPVAGQGLNLGLRDAVVLSAHLLSRKSLGLDMGSEESLSSYGKNRLKDRWALIGLTHFLTEGFKKAWFPPLWRVCANILRKTDLLKQEIVFNAVGGQLLKFL